MATSPTISKLLKDNKWHRSDANLSCACPDCAKERCYVCMRQDGRLLSINDEDLVDWYGVTESFENTIDLKILGERQLKLYVRTQNQFRRTSNIR